MTISISSLNYLIRKASCWLFENGNSLRIGIKKRTHFQTNHVITKYERIRTIFSQIS